MGKYLYYVGKSMHFLKMSICSVKKVVHVGTGFEHYSYEMSEFKFNEPSTMNL